MEAGERGRIEVRLGHALAQLVRRTGPPALELAAGSEGLELEPMELHHLALGKDALGHAHHLLLGRDHPRAGAAQALEVAGTPPRLGEQHAVAPGLDRHQHQRGEQHRGGSPAGARAGERQAGAGEPAAEIGHQRQRDARA